MATYEIGNGCESSIEAVLASNQKRRRVNKGFCRSTGGEASVSLVAL
jgi:hypothetical protein